MTQLGFSLEQIRRPPPVPPAPPPRRRHPLASHARARLALYVCQLAAKVPRVRELPVAELVAGGTLSENVEACAELRDRTLWQDLPSALGPAIVARADHRARAIGYANLVESLRDPTVGLAVVEDVIAEGGAP